MYTDHLKLSRRPFSQEPGEDFFVPNPGVAAAVSRVQHGITARDSVVVISGGPGVGKTALVEKALSTVVDRTIAVRIDMRCAEPDELYEFLLTGLGVETGKVSPTVAIGRLREAMARQHSEGRQIVLSLDLPGLNVELARRLLRLVNLAGEQGCHLSLVLQGPHNLHQMLDVPGLINLRQRVAFRYRVRPLTAQETAGYIRHALEQAGLDADTFLEPNIPASVYLFVAGVPRLINTLTDAVLSEACVQQLTRINAEVVRYVADQLGWKPLGGKPVAGQPAAAKAAQPGRKAAAAPEPVRAAPAAVLSSSDATSRLLAAKPLADDTGPFVLAAEASASPPVADRRRGTLTRAADGAPPVPMDPVDPDATGMLRLEDLDPRFAESLFSED